MNTIKVCLFSVKNRESGFRELWKLTGTPLSKTTFKKAFPNNYDLRTIRWIYSYIEVSGYQGMSVSPLYDSRDNVFIETPEVEE